MTYRIRDVHPHSISVHFTNALYPVSSLFLFLFLGTKDPTHLATHHHLLLLATVSAPISYATGILVWRRKYKSAWVRIFASKLRIGVLLMATGALALLMNHQYPTLLQLPGALRIAYLLVNAITVPMVAYLGYLGGRLVFGGAH